MERQPIYTRTRKVIILVDKEIGWDALKEHIRSVFKSNLQMVILLNEVNGNKKKCHILLNLPVLRTFIEEQFNLHMITPYFRPIPFIVQNKPKIEAFAILTSNSEFKGKRTVMKNKVKKVTTNNILSEEVRVQRLIEFNILKGINTKIEMQKELANRNDFKAYNYLLNNISKFPSLK